VVFSIYTPEIGTPLHDYCVANGLLEKTSDPSHLSKRAESNLRFVEYDKTFLTDIRQNARREINFGARERRVKIEKMFGCAIDGKQ
jgi:hypothetical protein